MTYTGTGTLSVDTGYFTGSLSYQAPYMTSPLVLSLGTGPDSNGIAWIIQKLEGWDSPQVSGQVIQRAADQGAYPAAQFYGPRTMTLTLRASAPDQYTRDLARALLQQVVPVNDLCTFTYNEPIPKVAYVRRSGQIPEQYDNLLEVVFSIVMVAPDPRKYSTTIYNTQSTAASAPGLTTIPMTIPAALSAGVAPGIIQCFNPGTYETRPDAIIRGPIVGPAISLVSTGQTVSWQSPDITLRSGDIMVVDFDARQAFLNGVYVAADVKSGWFVLNPGQNQVALTAASNSGGQLTMVYQAAWI